jgi:hypothetical protein
MALVISFAISVLGGTDGALLGIRIVDWIRA